MSTAATSTDLTVSKKEGLLSSDRVSTIYGSHVENSTHGGTLFRTLELASGLGILAATISVWSHFFVNFRFSFLELLISMISLLLAIMLLMVTFHIPTFVEEHDLVKSNTNVLTTLKQLRARGATYALAGLLQCTIFHPMNIAVGLFTTCVGLYMVRVGTKAAQFLKSLKASIIDEKALLAAFQQNDRNGDGVLEVFEFEGLMYSLGIELDSDELEAAFGSIDTNDDKKIVYDEFRTWWKACTADASNIV